MTEEETRKLYIRLAFQYESSIDALLTKGLIDTDLAAATKEKFYNVVIPFVQPSERELQTESGVPPRLRQSCGG